MKERCDESAHPCVQLQLLRIVVEKRTEGVEEFGDGLGEEGVLFREVVRESEERGERAGLEKERRTIEIE